MPFSQRSFPHFHFFIQRIDERKDLGNDFIQRFRDMIVKLQVAHQFDKRRVLLNRNARFFASSMIFSAVRPDPLATTFGALSFISS